MAVVLDQNSESAFVFGSVLEFIKCWEAGSDSRLILETINGKAWVNFSCCLGRPHANHVVTKIQKSPRKEFKDNVRAAAHNAKISDKENDTKSDDEEITAVTAESETTEPVDEQFDEDTDEDSGEQYCAVEFSTNIRDFVFAEKRHVLMVMEDSLTHYLYKNFSQDIDFKIGWEQCFQELDDNRTKIGLRIDYSKKNGSTIKMKEIFRRLACDKEKLRLSLPGITCQDTRRKIELGNANFVNCTFD